MNIKYDIIDGQVLAKDERDYITHFNLTNNIDEILELNNLIEEVRKQLYSITEYKNVFNSPEMKALFSREDLLKQGLKGIGFLSAAGFAICYGYSEFCLKTFGANLDAHIKALYREIPILIVGVSLIIISITTYRIHLTKRKEKELYYKVVQYKEELFKKYLKELEEQKAIKVQKENAADILIDTTNLDKWQKYLDAFSPLIDNILRYQRYYNRGALDTKLAHEYKDNEEVIHLIRDFYKEKNC